MIINPYDKARIENRFPGCTFKPIENDYETGHVYFSGYWHESFTVIDIAHNVPVWETVYSVVWENGNITNHATRPDLKRNFEIIA